MEEKWKNKNFLIVVKNSLNGIKNVFKSERNIKIQAIFAIIAILIGIYLKINFVEFSILVLTIFLVFVTETINTAIETVVDMFTLEYNEKAKTAKDIAAGAVTLASISSIIIGILIFLPKLLEII